MLITEKKNKHMFKILMAWNDETGGKWRKMLLQEGMSLQEKLGILADAASMMCPAHPAVPRGGEKPGCWGTQYHQEFVTAFAADGRCISLLKILFTNQCIYDCRYCINRRSNDVVRTSLPR